MTCSRLYGIASTDQSSLTSSSDILLRFAKERDQWKTMHLCQHRRSSLVIWRPCSLRVSTDWLHNSSMHACVGVTPSYCHDQPSSRSTNPLHDKLSKLTLLVVDKVAEHVMTTCCSWTVQLGLLTVHSLQSQLCSPSCSLDKFIGSSPRESDSMHRPGRLHIATFDLVRGLFAKLEDRAIVLPEGLPAATKSQKGAPVPELWSCKTGCAFQS